MADQRAAAVKEKAPPKATVTRFPAAKKWTIGDKEYIQDELSFLEKNDLFSLFSSHMQDAIDNGTDISKLLSIFAAVSNSGDDAAMAETFLKSFGSAEDVATEISNLILQFLNLFPRVLPDVFALALSVPEEDADEFKKALRTVDDDVGFGIIELFVHQNKKALVDFGKRWRVQYNTLLTSTS